MTFNDLKLSAPLLKAVSEAGYETPSPIQASAIPPVLEGRDLMGCAQTGTGKTAAFALPMLDRLSAAAPRRKGAVRALILTPTRELALQIGESFDAYGKYLKLRSTVIFGGVGQAPQVEAIRKGVDILIACPGRLNDLIGQGHIDLSNLEVFVLDEADRMLDMACNICSFNLAELCATTVALMKDPHHDIATTMPAPDFVGGGQILYDEAQMREIYEHGRGSVKVRARYNVVPGENMIEITQIPPTTTVEAIMDKIAELVKAGKIKEISDMRDETDLNGLKLTLDLKRGVDADKLMAKLFKTTPLEDSFSANFNILVAGQPRVMGVREILQEWTAFRVECVRRRTYYDLHGKEKRLHLLQGLAAILLDIDKAIKIIRTTEEESEVVPNLMIGFGIDEVQADYVAEIKLRHLNREYILKRTSEIEQLEKDIADLNDVLAKPARVRRIIINELNEVAKKYAQPRRSEILYDLPEEEAAAEEETVPDYPVTVFFTREGYLKKIPPQSLRTAGAHKLKESSSRYSFLGVAFMDSASLISTEKSNFFFRFGFIDLSF